MFVLFFTNYHVFTVIVSIFIVCGIIYFLNVTKWNTGVSIIAQKLRLNVLNIAKEAFSSFKFVKIHHKENYFHTKYFTAVNKLSNFNCRRTTMSELPKPLIEGLLISLICIGVLISIAFDKTNNAFSFIVVFVLFGFKILPIFSHSLRIYANLKFHYSCLDTLYRKRIRYKKPRFRNKKGRFHRNHRKKWMR